MADLVQITSFENKFSENLFSRDSILNDESVINFAFSGACTRTLNDYLNYSANKQSI